MQVVFSKCAKGGGALRHSLWLACLDEASLFRICFLVCGNKCGGGSPWVGGSTAISLSMTSSNDSPALKFLGTQRTWKRFDASFPSATIFLASGPLHDGEPCLLDRLSDVERLGVCNCASGEEVDDYLHSHCFVSLSPFSCSFVFGGVEYLIRLILIEQIHCSTSITMAWARKSYAF